MHCNAPERISESGRKCYSPGLIYWSPSLATVCHKLKTIFDCNQFDIWSIFISIRIIYFGSHSAAPHSHSLAISLALIFSIICIVTLIRIMQLNWTRTFDPTENRKTISRLNEQRAKFRCKYEGFQSFYFWLFGRCCCYALCTSWLSDISVRVLVHVSFTRFMGCFMCANAVFFLFSSLVLVVVCSTNRAEFRDCMPVSMTACIFWFGI